MIWTPSNEPTRYDRVRVAETGPIETEIKKLQLPPTRFRKLGAILNALIVQIEDGGDSPAVNRLLLEALRSAVRHQVGDQQARAVLRAIDHFEQGEAERWAMIKAGMAPSIELAPEEELDDLIQEGYQLMAAGQRTAACDKWLEAWEMIKEMATPDMRTVMDFDAVYPMMQSVYNWCGDLEMELGNAGINAPVYHEHRVRYVREFLARFPDADVNRHVMFRRAEAEALWQLGRQEEAEAVYQVLVSRFSNEGWAYIGWSDEYYMWPEREQDYEAGEAILLRALDRPDLDDREYVVDRLTRLYEKWNKPEKQKPLTDQLSDEPRNKSGTREPPTTTAKASQSPKKSRGKGRQFGKRKKRY